MLKCKEFPLYSNEVTIVIYEWAPPQSMQFLTKFDLLVEFKASLFIPPNTTSRPKKHFLSKNLLKEKNTKTHLSQVDRI